MTENFKIPQNPKAQKRFRVLCPCWEGLKHRNVVLLITGAVTRKAGDFWKKCAITRTLVGKRERLCHGAKTAARSSFRKTMWRSCKWKKKAKNLVAEGWRQMQPSSSSKKKKKSPRSKTLHGYQLSSNSSTTAQLRVHCYCNHLLEQVTPCVAQWWNPAHAAIPAFSPLIYAYPWEQLVFMRDSVFPRSFHRTMRCLPRSEWKARRICVATLRADRRPSA